MEAWRGVKASLLPTSNLALASSSYYLGMLVRKLMQKLHQVVRDPRAIAIKGLNVIFLNGVANLLGMELLKL